jgi:hypothetical protein
MYARLITAEVQSGKMDDFPNAFGELIAGIDFVSRLSRPDSVGSL